MHRLPFHDILYNDSQLGPYPDHLLKRVDAPTNQIPGPVERRSERENVYGKSLMGDFGEDMQREFKRLSERYPIVAAIHDLETHIAAYGKKRTPVAANKAPLPDDPRVMSRHLKALGYYLGADQVRIGPLAPEAVYSESTSWASPIEAPYKYAIVFACRKDPRSMSASNGWDDIVSPLSHQVYQKLAVITEVTAGYLRRLGIDAVPSYFRSYVTLMPRHRPGRGHGRDLAHGHSPQPLLRLPLQVRRRSHRPRVGGGRLRGLRPAGVLSQVHHLRAAVPLAGHPARPADPAQRLLHLEARRPGLLRLRHT